MLSDDQLVHGGQALKGASRGIEAMRSDLEKFEVSKVIDFIVETLDDMAEGAYAEAGRRE